MSPAAPDMRPDVLPLTLQGITLHRGGQRLLGPVDWVLAGAGLSAVIGPNGAGKSTLLRLMHGLERPSAGRLHWAVPTEAARRAQAFVFQSPVVLRRSLADNLAFPLRLAGMPRADQRARALDWAARLGLADRVDRPAGVLSRGERQKLALARALITEPSVLFLDEPTASLDGHATAAIEAMLLAERARGTRIVLATHDMGQARRLADEVVFLLGGRIHETGPAAPFFAAPQTEAAAAFLRGDIVT